MKPQLETILREIIHSNLLTIFESILHQKLFLENDSIYHNEGIIHDFLYEGQFEWKKRKISLLMGHEKPFMDKITPYMVKHFKASPSANDIASGAWDSFISYLFEFARQSLQEELLMFSLEGKLDYSGKIYPLTQEKSKTIRQIFVVRDPMDPEKVIGRFSVYLHIQNPY